MIFTATLNLGMCWGRAGRGLKDNQAESLLCWDCTFQWGGGDWGGEQTWKHTVYTLCVSVTEKTAACLWKTWAAPDFWGRGEGVLRLL